AGSRRPARRPRLPSRRQIPPAQRRRRLCSSERCPWQNHHQCGPRLLAEIGDAEQRDGPRYMFISTVWEKAIRKSTRTLSPRNSTRFGRASLPTTSTENTRTPPGHCFILSSGSNVSRRFASSQRKRIQIIFG